MDELVHHLDELPHRAALLHDVTGRGVERHHAVADAPAPLAFRVEPDDALHPLADLPDRPRLGIVVVVARVTQDQHGGLAVERIEVGAHEPAEREAEVGAAVIVDRRGLQRPFDRVVDRVGGEGLGDLRDLGDEDVGAHAREALLQVPHQLQHETGGVAHRVRHIAEGDQLRLLAVPAAEPDLHRPPPVLQALADGPARVQAALLLLALAEGERVLDLAGEPRDHRLHLGHLVRGEGEERLVGEDLAGELLALPVGAALQLALHVLADHAPERLETQVEVVADARDHARVEALRLQELHDAAEVALDRLPVELVVDAAGEVADLEEVHQPLEAGALALLADGHLHVAPLPAQEELGQLVHLHARLGGEPVEHLLDLRVLRTERLLEPLAEGLQVQEVEVEDAVEGDEVAGLLDQGGGERALEGLAILETDLGRGGERVEGLARRDPHLRAAEIADELENALVHLSRLNVDDFGLAVWPLRPFGAHRGARATGSHSHSTRHAFIASALALARPHRDTFLVAHRAKWTQEDLKTSSPPSRVIGYRRASSSRMRPWNEPCAIRWVIESFQPSGPAGASSCRSSARVTSATSPTRCSTRTGPSLQRRPRTTL